MSFKSNLLGAAATFTIVGGLSAVGTVSSSAATPQCGPHCIEVFSPRFGTADQPKFVETARGGVSRLGAAAILYSASSSNPAEDWVVPTGGPVPVSRFFSDGLVSATVDSHYGKLEAARDRVCTLRHGHWALYWRLRDPVPERGAQPPAVQDPRQYGMDNRHLGCATHRERELRVDQRI